MHSAVLSVDIASHDLTRRGWSLMGERVWDAIVGIDVLAALPAVDETRLGTVGLSLGGEAVMYVAALDERVQAAISSGWVTTIENMKVNHCPCWNFDGLEEAFDFSDIFACVAPRRLVLENGSLEPSEIGQGGFPTKVARATADKIAAAYEALGAAGRSELEVHGGAHAFSGVVGYPMLADELRHAPTAAT